MDARRSAQVAARPASARGRHRGPAGAGNPALLCRRTGAAAAGARGRGGEGRHQRRRHQRSATAGAPLLAQCGACGDGLGAGQPAALSRGRGGARRARAAAATGRTYRRDCFRSARFRRSRMPAADGRKGVLLSTIAVHVEDAVARITLDRPDKRNAINDDMRNELTAAFAALDADPSVRVVVLTGAGSAFCAGGDLIASATPDPQRPRIVEPLDQFSKPVIAAINGLAFGGGLELALACDLRIAATGARFALPEVRIGSLPGSGGTQRLPAVIGPSLAAQMILTGEPIDAARALAAGLVTELCEPDKLLDVAMGHARTIARNAPLAVIAAKRALRVAAGTHRAENLDVERKLFNELALSEDRNEGRQAFREKRQPVFKGK